MKKVKVLIRDKNTLVVKEDAAVDDIIDLTEVMEIDTSAIMRSFEDAKEDIYNKRLSEQEKVLETEYSKRLLEQENSIRRTYLAEIETLKEKNNTLKIELESNVQLEKTKLQAEYDRRIFEQEKALNELKYHYQNEMLIKEKEITSKYESAIKEKDELINNLQRQRVSMNVKQTGEDLESWCNNEAMQYMQNGFFNCTWEKDNELVGSENTKRSKADYIFKIYSSLNHTEDTLLTSVCLEMKDENPASTNKQTNQYYYKALNENREKKNCKYALLVSNLERDKPNMIPMYKVKEYEDMYVVRPAYMMTFLSMLVSLTKRFEDIINSEEATKLELKSSMDLIAEFNDIKLTYLDKPLTTLNKELETILKNNATISDAARKIEASCEKIATSYINQITSKLDKFELNLNRKVVKKL